MFNFEKRIIRYSTTLLKNRKCFRNYSRSRDSKNVDSFKIVNSKDVIEDSRDGRFECSPNWELFGARGQRFLLPGSVGPAWHESCSMVPVDGFKRPLSKPSDIDFDTLECTAQECPVLLRKGISELFPGADTTAQQITVVTLTRKNLTKIRKNNKKDSEYYAKTFMWAAQEICMRLKAAGFWADFINPFSGRPYLGPFNTATLYETDERFRCIGFEIQPFGVCKVIQSKKGAGFIGSLFTNAPASTTFLMELLNE